MSRSLAKNHEAPQWWGFGDYAKDQPGVAVLTLLRDFLTRVVAFEDLRPAGGLVVDGPTGRGERPLALATEDRRVVAVYLPVGGEVVLDVPAGPVRTAWYDPRTGELSKAVAGESDGRLVAKSPGGGSGGRPYDWTLVVDG